MTDRQQQVTMIVELIRSELETQRRYAEDRSPSAGMTTPDQHRHTASVLNLMLELIAYLLHEVH